jgi:hypothetical protein
MLFADTGGDESIVDNDNARATAGSPLDGYAAMAGVAPEKLTVDAARLPPTEVLQDAAAAEAMNWPDLLGDGAAADAAADAEAAAADAGLDQDPKHDAL